MSFVNPQFFWVMIVPFVILTFLITTNKQRLSRVFDEKVLKRLSATDESMPMMVRNVLIFFSIFLMIVAMARPVMEKGDKKVEVEGITLLTALDISGSMRSNDVYPNRLEFAKKKMNTLFDAMPSDEIGVVAFAHSPFVLAPFTSDKETLKMMVEGVDDSYINMGSTDFSALGEQVSALLEEKKPKILVLFTDGGDKEAIEGFEDILKESNIDLYVVLVGTQKGAPVLDENGNPFKDKKGNIAITQRNDTLADVAKSTGGISVVASTGKKDISKLATVIKNRYKNQEQGEVTIKERVEYFYYPLGLSLLVLLIAFSSLPKRREV
ncbi:MAG: VWA domain-containing protein [Sulfurovum sp.]|nr:VWA domain-containing protein [Sulfurovum sp.]